MYRKLLLIAGLILILAITAQAQTNQEQNDMTDKKILVAYFSLSGNTRDAALQIQALTGGDSFEIKTVQSYPAEYDATTRQAREELDRDFRPELAAKVDNMADYDVVILGYPCWLGTMPMALFTFLEQYDFTGKTIVPFTTHGGSGLGRSVSDITRLCPNATIADGLALRGSGVKNAGNDIKAWLTKLKLIK